MGKKYPLSIFIIVIAFILSSCGGGGGGGGSSSTLSATVTLAGLSGEIDPDGDGTVLITYYLSAPKEREVNVRVEFSTDGGTAYSICTEDHSPTINGGISNITQGTTGLLAGPGGTVHHFAWDTDAPGDLPGQNLNSVRVRVSVMGGGKVMSSYLIVTNDGSDVTAPELSTLTATAVKGPSNDTIKILFNEPVLKGEAEDRTHYVFQHPGVQPFTLPEACDISYNPVTRTASILLDTALGPNLHYGQDFRVTASGIHDLLGNDIAAGAAPARTAAVDGDGEGGSADQPQLQTAYFVGTGAPGAGEYVYLVYNEEIVLQPGSLFNNTDMDFWDGGDTIGTSSPIPITLEDACTVRITLGTSPVFTVNTSRIQTSTFNDVITDLAGNAPYVPAVPVRNDYLVVAKYDEIPPVLEQLSINHIPDILNGTGPAGGEMLAPRKGFDITMEYDDGDGSGVDTDAIVILCSKKVTVGGSTVSAGTNLAPDLNLVASSATGATFRVPAAMQFKTGSNILWARVTDFMGLSSTSLSFAFDVTNSSNSMRPFETGSNPSQVWNIRFTRDIYTINVSGAANITVSATMNPNGIPDFNEDMICFGLRSLAPIAVPGTALNSNQLLYQELVAAIKTELSDVIFPGVNITFTELNQGVIPGNAPQVSYNNFSHSQISVGGDSDVGALGTAWIDRNNAHQDNNMLYKGSAPYNPGTNLGMFTTRLFKFSVNGSQFSLFRQTFDDFIPGRGTPVGEGADDEDILMEIAGTGPAVGGAAAVRRDSLLFAIAGLARSISVITAHEMGHSMGLSVNDPMPDGLYGGDPIHFPGSSDSHLDLSSFPALYTAPAVNIMTPATNYWYTSAVGTRFNYLNMAYLQEKVFYRP